MSKNKIFIYIFFSLFVAFSVKAQEQELDCNFNVQEALFYLEGSENVKKDSLKAIEYLKPCLEAKNSNAQLIMGRIYLNSLQEDTIQKGFQLIKKAAKQNHAIALENLGVLYKYGRGCKLNYNKARKAYEEASQLGNQKATYSLGYLHLKGLGDTEQDYKKAVAWFEKSDYPMATYWLGVCYLHGYGVVKDISKANALLITNFEDQITSEVTKTIIETNTQNIVNELDNTEETTEITNISKELVFGKWKGKLLQLDWSSKSIEEMIPLELEIKHDSITNTIQYIWKVNNLEQQGVVEYLDNTLYFENLQTSLPNQTYHEDIPKTLNYQILSSALQLKHIENTNYLIGDLESYIPDWNEPSIPMQFVLTKESITTENNVEISEAVLQALATQRNNFVKLYPNPFESDLIIGYTLNEPSHIQIEVMPILDNTQYHTVEKGQQQQAGDYQYHFEGRHLKSGLYAVSVYVNGTKKTRLIVKK